MNAYIYVTSYYVNLLCESCSDLLMICKPNEGRNTYIQSCLIDVFFSS